MARPRKPSQPAQTRTTASAADAGREGFLAPQTPSWFTTAMAEYQVVRQLGQGGSGRVFEALDGSGEIAAIKLLDPSRVTGEKRKRFRNELNFSLRNQHPCILTLRDYGTVRIGGTETPFYVMPLYPQTLRSLIHSGVRHERCMAIIAQLLDGLEAAHRRGIWHRDLKPENVLFDSGGTALVIADWGCAHFDEDELHTQVETAPHARLANFQYAAPEQRRPGQDIDHRADIYALGLMMNEIFTAEVIHGTGYKTVASAAPEYDFLDDIIEQLVRQKATERPSSIEMVKQMLTDQGVSDVTITPPTEAGVSSPSKPGGGVEVSRVKQASVQLRTSVQAARPNQEVVAKRFMIEIAAELKRLKPDFPDGTEWDDLLIAALEKSVPLVAEFGRVSHQLAEMNATIPSVAVYEGFGPILEGYDTPPGFAGHFYPAHFDLQRFLGHELFVTLFAALIHQKRWPLIADLLGRDLYVEKAPASGRADLVPYYHLSERVRLLEHRNQRLAMRLYSLHAKILFERHSQGELAEVVPADRFIDADYFLGLRSLLTDVESDSYPNWEPWSALYLRSRIPRFLVEAVSKRTAGELLPALGVESIETLRERLRERSGSIARVFEYPHFRPLDQFNFDSIGSR